jgi:hypothetical protein
VDLDINESFQIEHFHKHLKDDVHDALALIKKQDGPTYFNKYVDLCISIKNSLHHHECEKTSGIKA